MLLAAVMTILVMALLVFAYNKYTRYTSVKHTEKSVMAQLTRYLAHNQLGQTALNKLEREQVKSQVDIYTIVKRAYDLAKCVETDEYCTNVEMIIMSRSLLRSGLLGRANTLEQIFNKFVSVFNSQLNGKIVNITFDKVTPPTKDYVGLLQTVVSTLGESDDLVSHLAGEFEKLFSHVKSKEQLYINIEGVDRNVQILAHPFYLNRQYMHSYLWKMLS